MCVNTGNIFKKQNTFVRRLNLISNHEISARLKNTQNSTLTQSGISGYDKRPDVSQNSQSIMTEGRSEIAQSGPQHEKMHGLLCLF